MRTTMNVYGKAMDASKREAARQSRAARLARESGLVPLSAPQMLSKWIPLKVGGADGIRTHDLLDAIEARSQLRHGPTGGTTPILTSRPSLRLRLESRRQLASLGLLENIFTLAILTPAKRVVWAACSFRILAYGKINFSGRSRVRHRFEISCRSGRQAAASGLRNFSGLAGAARPQLQAPANR